MTAQTNTPSTMTEIMKMDGRKRVAASPVLGPLRDSKFSVAMVRATIKQFLEHGSTNHSGGRAMLGFVIAYCEENGVAYSLHATFTKEGRRAGYYMKREENI